MTIRNELRIGTEGWVLRRNSKVERDREAKERKRKRTEKSDQKRKRGARWR